MNKKMVEIITLQTIMINNAQNNFFFKDKGKEMRLQMHGLIEKKKKQINIINTLTSKINASLVFLRFF
jgi:phage gp45-like